MSSRAPASCFSCRRSKRRCDKNLPTCQLCSQKGAKCSYPRRRGQSSPSPTRSVQGSDYDTGSNSPYTRELVAVPRSTGSLYNSASSISSPFAVTTAIRFLAPDVFREARLEIPRLDVGIPDEVAYHLGDNHQVRETASKFFQESWLPIISRKRYLAAILNPLSPSRRPTALLALCMKLCCSSAYDEESPRKNSLYKLVKKFYSEVESTQDLCVEVLQAAILIAIFEIGDAVYPAAYLTVGVCARYGIAMGLDKINKDRMGERYDRMGSWMEIEERRRAWWAILILDRFVTSYSSLVLSSSPERKIRVISSIFPC
ncbi:hypothetical protein N7533_007773 [Penicillium manginii]|uniref:uncharacterized protein n=1 Tax=Penicillium manginii TaxID=203109 RepID=UPI00254730E1|nr:uncharacterized protein N7533_007773 [Penicillium manginii]KAJ5750745.1 hypothetical protein N7533_007773 [Penicillium manginii]